MANRFPKRGRPPKDPEDRKSETIRVKMRPSGKMIIQQEIERCNVSMGDVFRQHAFEEIEPQGGGGPVPAVFMEITSIAEDLYETAKSEEASWLNVELINIQSELTRKQIRLEEAEEKRERLRRQTATEKFEKALTVRVTSDRKEWLESYAGYEEMPVTSFFRQKAVEGLRKREKISRAVIWVDRWAGLLDPLIDRDCERHEEETRKEMKRIAEEIDDRIFTDVIREQELK